MEIKWKKLIKYLCFFLLALLLISLEYILLKSLQSILFSSISISILVYIIFTKIMIILHYILARKVTMSFLFPGGSWIFNKVSEKKFGHFQANCYKNELLKFKEVLDALQFSTGKNEKIVVERMIDALQLVKQTVLLQFTIYDKMDKLYTLSSYQKSIFLELSKLKKSIESCSFVEKLSSLMENSNENFIEIDINIKEITDLNNELDNLIRIIDSYLSEKSFFKQILTFFFDNTFGSQNHYKIELKQKHNCEEIKVKTKDNTKLDALLFSPVKLGTKNSSQNVSQILESEGSLNSSKYISTSRVRKNLIIFCGPNGQCFEYYSVNDRWLKFYLDNGIYVCFWNYRSFGESTGCINIQNIKDDADILYDFLKKHYHWDNIGVHGLSIGGIPACHLASYYLNFCCADRSFSNIEDIVKEYKFGSFLVKLYRFLRINDADNSSNMKNSNSYKILTIDPNDELIKPNSSLLTGISKLMVDNLVKKGRIKSLPKEKKEKFFLCHFLNDFDFEVFFSHFQIIISNLNETVMNSSFKSKGKKNSYKILNEENTVSVITVESKQSKSDLTKIFTSFRTINKDLLQMNNFDKPIQSKNFMDDFFMNLLLWGCSFNDSFVSKKTLYKKTYVNFSNFISKLAEYSKSEADPKICKSIEILLPLLKKIEKGFIEVVFKSSESYDLSEFYEKNVDINLIILKCGHNGIPGYQDLEIYTSNLFHAGFINDNNNN